MHTKKLTGGLHVNSLLMRHLPLFWVIYAVCPTYFLRKCMMSPSGPTLAQIEVVDIVITIMAIIITSFRLYVRVRQGRLWIDDVWATLGMTFNFILLVVSCLYLQDFGECFLCMLYASY
ncbi:uncharacterized protein BJ212DRAFT_632064 [Suillus subaureus]|uniref:Uncharacterized protein n=1 Tax=Suillus subaureus TaxID=48587 RepID=A0A9P7E272_9AGAM|nr:uncharacterized protein BJ212DRAFT_632064 [Suillus subaureus]KAG1808973.1 hypothetical protein BJ212DRAFT_632064 [Suillus subaureus]